MINLLDHQSYQLQSELSLNELEIQFITLLCLNMSIIFKTYELN